MVPSPKAKGAAIRPYTDASTRSPLPPTSAHRRTLVLFSAEVPAAESPLQFLQDERRKPPSQTGTQRKRGACALGAAVGEPARCSLFDRAEHVVHVAADVLHRNPKPHLEPAPALHLDPHRRPRIGPGDLYVHAVQIGTPLGQGRRKAAAGDVGNLSRGRGLSSGARGHIRHGAAGLVARRHGRRRGPGQALALRCIACILRGPLPIGRGARTEGPAGYIPFTSVHLI